MTRHRIGVIGLGMAVTPHAKSLLDLRDRIEVACAFSRSEARRQAFAQRFDFPTTGDLEQIASDPSIDAVMILTPPNTHLELVERFAAAGKHILLEKPLERSTERALRLVEAAEAAGVKLGVVFQHRFREASEHLRALLRQRALGALAVINVSCPWWRAQSYYDEPGRGTLARDGGGVLITQAIHTLDLTLSLAGPIAEVAAIAGTTGLHRMESEDFAAAGLRFANGALGALMATTAEYPGFPERIELIGTEGTAILAAGVVTVHYQDGRREALRRGAGHRRRRRSDGVSPRCPPRAACRFPRRPRPGSQPARHRPRGAARAPSDRRRAAVVRRAPRRRDRGRLSTEPGMPDHPPLKFAAIGLDHRHIYHQVGRLLELGAECKGYYARDSAVPLDGFVRRFPDLPRVRTCARCSRTPRSS